MAARFEWDGDWNERLRVQHGKEQEAKDYYERISKALSFPFEGSTLDSLLAYMGYTVANGGGGFQGLPASDLEKLSSFTLMPRDATEFAALKNAVADPAA